MRYSYYLLLVLGLLWIGFLLGSGIFIFLVVAGGLWILFLSLSTQKVDYGRYPISRDIKNDVLKRQDRTCAVPGCYQKDYLALHHKIPVSLGGSNTLDNLEYLCPNHHAQAHDSRNRGSTVNYRGYHYG